MATLGFMMMILIVNLSLPQGTCKIRDFNIIEMLILVIGSTSTTIEYTCKATDCGLECNCSDLSCNSTYLTITLCGEPTDCGQGEIRISCSDSNDISRFCKGNSLQLCEL